MSPATELNTPIPTRRALLAGAPAIAAAALAGGTVATALAMAPPKAGGLDWPAIVLRADGLIDDLRNYYAEWTIADEERAAQVLKYCRAQEAGLPEDDAAWAATVDFVEHHNQSLDWMIYGDPVSMIAKLAARSSRAMLGAGVDPVFAAIERERAAYAAYLVTSTIQSQISDQNPFPAPRSENRRAEKKRLKSPEHKAWWARYQEAEEADRKTYNEMCDARADFLKTQPTSVAGLRAFINHIDGPFSSGNTGEALWDETEAEAAFPTLAAATRNIIARGQA
jgi:hypothetical protein